MKTAVSIPNDLFEQGEALAKARKISRSELYAQALRKLIQAQTGANVTASFDEAYADVEQGEVDAWGDLREFRSAVRNASRSKRSGRRE